MKEVKKRKAHLPEFKAKVGLEALRGEKTVNQIGQEYGVHPVQVGQWKKEIQAQAKTLFEGRRGPKWIGQSQAAGTPASKACWTTALPVPRGYYVYEEVPHAGARAGVTGRGPEGFTDAVLKVFGI